MTLAVGDKVLRKNGDGGIGQIESIRRNGKAYVRWENVLRPFAGGYRDNHSQIALSALVPATDENVRQHRLKRALKNLDILKERAKQRYCKIHRCRCNTPDGRLRCCYCKRELAEDETFSSQETAAQLERAWALIAELNAG